MGGLTAHKKEVKMLSYDDCYNSIANWNRKKNFKNFCMVYKYGFYLEHLWQRPLWRVWRIVRNTWVSKKYQEFTSVKGAE